MRQGIALSLQLGANFTIYTLDKINFDPHLKNLSSFHLLGFVLI